MSDLKAEHEKAEDRAAALERAERAFVEEAITRAREEGLLPPDYTAGRYEAIAGSLRP